MERLTTNKPVSEMGMYELAHNSCYISEDGSARYRDYDTDIDAREFAKNLYKTHAGIQMPIDINEFDEYIADDLMIDPSEPAGLIALFYRNLWAMADLRERLAYYEELAEQGLLLKLPVAEGDTVYKIITRCECDCDYECEEYFQFKCEDDIPCEHEYEVYRVVEYEFHKEILGMLGKTIFLTKAEAEKALEEMEK